MRRQYPSSITRFTVGFIPPSLCSSAFCSGIMCINEEVPAGVYSRFTVGRQFLLPSPVSLLAIPWAHGRLISHNVQLSNILRRTNLPSGNVKNVRNVGYTTGNMSPGITQTLQETGRER